MLVAVVGGTLLSLARTYRSIAAEQAIESAAIAALDRLSREARNATSVDVGGSVLGTSPGQLSLNTKDPDGAPEVVQFFLEDKSLHVREAGVDQGSLTPAAARVTNLIFRTIATGKDRHDHRKRDQQRVSRAVVLRHIHITPLVHTMI